MGAGVGKWSDVGGEIGQIKKGEELDRIGYVKKWLKKRWVYH